MRWCVGSAPILSFAAIAAIAACGGDGGSLGPTSYDFAGDRYWEESLEDPQLSVQCFDAGMVTVTQNGSRFQASGHITGACTGPGGQLDIDGQTQVTGGVFDGDAVRFTVDGCPYHGIAHGEAPDSITGQVSCTSTQDGVTVHLTGTWRLLRAPPDLYPPGVFGSFTGSSAPPAIPDAIMLRDTLRITVQASDDRGLTWVGYALGGSMQLADSIMASGQVAAPTLSVVIAPAMVGNLTITAFARDSAGHRTEYALGALRVLNIRNAVTRSLTLPGPVTDMAYDAKRGRMYLSIAGMPTVAVVDVPASQLGPSLILPGNAAGLDLSPGGDSLLVALGDRSALAVVNLVTGQVDTVHLPFDQSFPRVASRLRVAANGMVLVTATIPGWSGALGQLAALNLVSGVVAIRSDVGMGGALDFNTELARLGDRSRVALVETNACCPIKAYLYLSATDAFTSAINTLDVFPREVQGTQTGNRFFMATTVFTEALGAVGTYTDVSTYLGQPTAITADGSQVILGGTPENLLGFVMQSVASHQVLDRVYVPGWGQIPDTRFASLPDGHTLAVYQSPFAYISGTTTLQLVELR